MLLLSASALCLRVRQREGCDWIDLPELERVELDHSVFRFNDDLEDTTLIMRSECCGVV